MVETSNDWRAQGRLFFEAVSQTAMGRSPRAERPARAPVVETSGFKTTPASPCLPGDRIDESRALEMAEILKSNIALKVLIYKANSISKTGVLAIAEALKTNTTLTTLDFGENEIGEAGAKAILEALVFNTTLTSVKIHSNQVDEDTLDKINNECRLNASRADAPAVSAAAPSGGGGGGGGSTEPVSGASTAFAALTLDAGSASKGEMHHDAGPGC